MVLDRSREEDQGEEAEHTHAQPERDPEVCHERQPQLEQDRQAPEGPAASRTT
jgi:hypothetical protein